MIEGEVMATGQTCKGVEKDGGDVRGITNVVKLLELVEQEISDSCFQVVHVWSRDQQRTSWLEQAK